MVRLRIPQSGLRTRLSISTRLHEADSPTPGKSGNQALGRPWASTGDLPAPMRSLELKSVWGDEALENRIVSGTYRGEEMF